MMTNSPRPLIARVARAAVTAAATVVVAACAGGASPDAPGAASPSTTEGAAATPDPTPPSAAAAEAGLLDFTAETVSGETVDVAEYAGRDVAVWFWAPW